MTLEGIGEILALGLNTGDEREFSIDSPGLVTASLANHLRMRIRLTGSVIGTRIVNVTHWNALDTSQDH
jgi:hypothetical protein